MAVNEMTERTRASWLLYALGALCAGAIVAAVLLVGPASSSQATITRTAKAAQGVVQSTVSGSGNLQSASQLNLGFKTGGTVTHIYVSQGQQVSQGQLLATLDPQSAEVTLEQAKASLQAAEANLAKEQETDGEGSSAASSGAGSGGTASAASLSDTTPASTTPAGTAPTTTAPGNAPSSSTTNSKRTSNSTGAGTTTTGETKSSESKGKATGTVASESKATLSAATREANLASARAAVKSDTLTVQSDEQAVQDTKLYAPQSGTIVSLAGQVGEVVSGSGTTRTSSSASSSSGSGSSATSAAATSTGRSTTGAGSSSAATGSTGASSSAFAVLSDLSSMQLVVALSESEIGDVKDGQFATVSVEALSATKLAAHVSEVALLSTSSSGAVSYDVTFQLDQLAPGLRIGMSATAEVVVKQAEGVNVPTTAVSADSVTVERAGKQVRQRVVTGLAGNTSTIILSGVKAGETVVLPAASSTSSATSLTSRLGGRTGGLGGAGGLAGAGGGVPGGGAAFFRGGG
jgi:multidrug efflux pump subunit AcrA (membrane-fusion protein)